MSVVQRLRSWFIPLPWSEIRQALPLFGLFFLSSFVYNLLRPLKISLIVTAPNAGADVIPFLKLWAILPASFFFAYLYAKLSNKFNRTQVFYALISIFLGFFLLFIILYPLRTHLELNSLANILETILPKGLHGLITIIRYWFLALFYVMAELWGNIILTVLCWGFVNECISINKAKKFYALIAVSADSAGIFSGQFGNLIQINKFNPTLLYGNTAWEQTLIINLVSVLLIGGFIIFLYNKINSPHNVLFKPTATSSAKSKPIPENKIKISLLECLKYTIRSPYMLCLAMIVVAYFMSYNLFDVIWTDQLQKHYKSAAELNTFLNKLTSCTGILAASIAFFISGNVIRNLGWRAAALITPIVMLITTICFFSSILLNQTWFSSNVLTTIGSMSASMHTIIICGTVQYCLCRACKYTVFDSTKEMAFIPLPVNQQRQGKVVIDTIVSRFSKTGSAILFHALLLTCGTLAAAVPYVAVIILAIIPLWILAINTLNKITKKTIDIEEDLNHKHRLVYVQ